MAGSDRRSINLMADLKSAWQLIFGIASLLAAFWVVRDDVLEAKVTMKDMAAVINEHDKDIAELKTVVKDIASMKDKMDEIAKTLYRLVPRQR